METIVEKWNYIQESIFKNIDISLYTQSIKSTQCRPSDNDIDSMYRLLSIDFKRFKNSKSTCIYNAIIDMISTGFSYVPFIDYIATCHRDVAMHVKFYEIACIYKNYIWAKSCEKVIMYVYNYVYEYMKLNDFTYVDSLYNRYMWKKYNHAFDALYGKQRRTLYFGRQYKNAFTSEDPSLLITTKITEICTFMTYGLYIDLLSDSTNFDRVEFYLMRNPLMDIRCMVWILLNNQLDKDKQMKIFNYISSLPQVLRSITHTSMFMYFLIWNQDEKWLWNSFRLNEEITGRWLHDLIDDDSSVYEQPSSTISTFIRVWDNAGLRDQCTRFLIDLNEAMSNKFK